MKIISYALWGDSPVYNTGALRNAELAPEFYPGWECRFYCARDLPDGVIARLEAFPHVRVVRMNEDGSHRGLFWRFFPASDPAVEVMLSRDCDSRIEYRETMAVREWMRSGNRFHVMRDHPQHNVAVLAGMFGVKRGVLPDMRAMVEAAPEYASARHGSDQDFLTGAVWPRVRESAMIHDDATGPGPWPVPRSDCASWVRRLTSMICRCIQNTA